MNRFRLIALAALIWTLPAVPVAAMDTFPAARDDSVLGAFQAECLREVPDYDRLDGQAKALGMADLGGHAAPGEAATMVRSHRWGGKLPDGPFALYVSSVTSKIAIETSCGISGAVANAEHFRDGLVRTMGLPPLESHSMTADGSTIYIWRDIPLRDQRLILQTKTAKDGQGFVLLTLAVRKAP